MKFDEMVPEAGSWFSQNLLKFKDALLDEFKKHGKASFTARVIFKALPDGTPDVWFKQTLSRASDTTETHFSDLKQDKLPGM